MKKTTIQKVASIGDLFLRALTDERYANLALISASNLGGEGKTLSEARRWLELNASEGTEEGVVQEINHCRDLVK